MAKSSLVSLTNTSGGGSQKGTTNYIKTAEKLHIQFAHPTADTLLKMVRRSKFSSYGLRKAIIQVTNNCVICMRRQRRKPRPRVCVPLAGKFNELVSMDLKYHGGAWILVLVDNFTRFRAASVVKNK